MVAVGQGNYSIAYSDDNGTTWTGVPDSSNSSIFDIGFSIAYNGSRWIADGSGNYKIAYSDDGISWIGITNNTFFTVRGAGIATSFIPQKWSNSIVENLYVNKDAFISNSLTVNKIFNSSDIRLKDNIQSLNNCTEVINRLNPVSWKWKDNNMGNKTNYGFIAQEIEEIEEFNNSDIIKKDYEDGFMRLQYQQLIGYISGSIKSIFNKQKNLDNLISKFNM